MIDVHCHILPGVDDGARDLEEALDMARAAEREGVIAIFGTPHIARGSYYMEPGDIRQAAQALAVSVKEAGIPVSLYPGAENHPESDLPDGCRSGKVMTLGASKYVLVEAPGTELPWFFETVLFKLMVGGFLLVLAHPERNPTLNHDFERLVTISRTGVVLQVNARSLTGFYGSRVQVCATRIIREHLVGLVGSDAHQPQDYRGLKKACEMIGLIGGDEAHRIISRNEEMLMNALGGLE